MTTFDLETWLTTRRGEVDALLDARLGPRPPGDDPGRLIEAMRYSLLAPGKRLRPVFALAAAEAMGAELNQPVRMAAVAVELVHCYSLVHDDLPCMDDDDFRRGRPTSHKVFGDATAVLAGDALLTLAFEWLSEAGIEAARRATERGKSPEGVMAGYLRATSALARGAGVSGMVRGQARDLGEPPARAISEVEQLHAEKTGALFRAALEVGGAVGGATADQLSALARYGEAYGVAFQHADDRDDHEHDGFADEARQRIQTLTEEALTSVSAFGPTAEPLRALARALAKGKG